MPDRKSHQHSQEVFSNSESITNTAEADTSDIDAFGRKRVSDATTLFDNSFEYDSQPLFWDTKLSGGADIVHSDVKHAVVMTVSGSTAGTGILQSLAYHPYQKGKSQRIVLTFAAGEKGKGVTRRVGYFDTSDGVFLEQTNEGNFFVLRSSTSGAVVNTRVKQSDWSQNSFAGTGNKTNPNNTSMLNSFIADNTRRQILDIDLEWLGVGRVRYGFNINGRTIYAHYINNANVGIAAPYMRTGTLPVRYEIINDGTGPASEFIAMCSVVFSEGGFEKGRGIPFTADRGVVPASVGTRVPILSIRPKLTFNGLENRSQITPLNLSVFTQVKSVLVEVVYNGLLFGTGSFVSVADNSAVEFNNSFTAISGGFPVQSFYVSTAGTGGMARGGEKSPIISNLPLALDIDGANPIPLTVVCTPLAMTATVHASISGDEVR